MTNQKRDNDPTLCTRIGIDFGNTIGRTEFPEPASFAFEMISHLVSKFRPENVFVVSKARPEMQRKISSWLDETNFYEQTDFLPENIVFVLQHSDKALVVQRLGISIFFDDSTKVVKHLAPLNDIVRIFWMHADQREIQQIPRQFRTKIAITKDWSKTMKYFQRIRSNGKGSRTIRS